MTKILWDQVGERVYETGVDQGVLYIPDAGVYDEGYAWNGLSAVTEQPSGAEATPVYADNIKYLNLLSAEEFGGTIEAYTYPEEFAQCDGTAQPQNGVFVGQQNRKVFGLSYRTKLGNDVDGQDHGYKLHLVYGALAAPSEKAFNTVNDAPEALAFSWTFSTTPVPVTGLKPSAILTIDSTQVNPANLAALEDALYGTAGTSPRLPLPDEVITMFAGAQTAVTPLTPTFVSATGVITIPAVTGVTYYRADTNAVVPTGTVTIAGGAGASLVIKARPSTGAYKFTANADDDWSFVRTA
jgi:hypothetical protein